jgi:diguanylate cyclase (GGDEF)-like protein
MADIQDELTQLHNRRSFLSLLHRQTTFANERRTMLALLVVDIDHFVQINGANGYAFGDHVLRHLAAQVAEVARKQDYACRIGDNRFALILTRLLNHGHADLAVQKLLRLLDVPVEFGQARLNLAVTIGVALCPAHATHPEFLLRKAELALASARREGRRYLFAADMPQTQMLSDLWDLEVEMAGAIERGEMRILFQPQVRVSDLRLVGAEALMRWNTHTRGLVSPDVFIPLAERTGQIKPLTVWAMNTVLRQASEWKHDWGPLSVAVNLPSELASQRDLPELVENALHLWGSDAVRLMLEITERSLMERETAQEKLSRIRQLGARISIDDFGTGYSCLAYFRNIPADELKIDKSFVTGLLNDTASADITALIIELAHRFGLDVVGEGVEDEATLEKLRAGGCDIAQGYLFGKPMPTKEFQAWMNAYRPDGELPAGSIPG